MSNMDWDKFNEQLGGLLSQAQEAIQTFMERCAELDQVVQPELRGLTGIFTVSGPRLTDEQVSELMDMMPSMIKVQFMESVKRSTLERISRVLQEASPFLIVQMALLVNAEESRADLRLACAGTPPEDESVWDTVKDILEDDPFVRTWSCQMNEKILWKSAPLHGESQTEAPKTNREKVISDDDVIDLKAALGKSQTVEEFMEQMFGPKDEDS